MDDTADTANVIIHPPIAWALAIIVGLALDRLVPLAFMPAALPAPMDRRRGFCARNRAGRIGRGNDDQGRL